MIELSWSGLRVRAIAVELGCSQKTVRCWLYRFNRLGLQGLDDLGGRSIPVLDAIEEPGEEMIGYGFDAVRESAPGHSLVGQDPLPSTGV
ncbi:helix-turn-helix domain-containing protein [Streptomyces mirabilis]|uniref:helix-turn-helix domain-containing protein n=1 Tax=Streptomyces mirabilis TaxID=68239 RepID=UPI00324C6BA2